MKKRTFIRLISFPLAFCGLMIGMCIYQTELTADYEKLLNNTYQQGLFDLSANINEIERELESSLILSSAKSQALCAAKIMLFSARAKCTLDSFPLYGENTDILSLYLGQVGEYSFSLSEKMIQGKSFTQEDRDNLSAILDHTRTLSEKIKEVETLALNGNFHFASLETPISTRAGHMRIGKEPPNQNALFSALSKERGYPDLIYDGAYSDHNRIKGDYAVLFGKEEKSEEAAKEIAAQFLSTTPDQLKPMGKSTGTPTLYTFGAADMSLDIFATGHVLYMVNGREIGETALNEEEALQKALGLLAINGYENMVHIKTESSANLSTFTFAYSFQETIYYTDKILVTVALDKGDIVDFYALDYIKNHTAQRILPNGRISLDKGSGFAPTGHTVNGTRYAVIASRGGFEQHAIELATNKEERNYLYYIDALDGSELALVNG